MWVDNLPRLCHDQKLRVWWWAINSQIMDEVERWLLKWRSWGTSEVWDLGWQLARLRSVKVSGCISWSVAGGSWWGLASDLFCESLYLREIWRHRSGSRATSQNECPNPAGEVDPKALGLWCWASIHEGPCLKPRWIYHEMTRTQ